MTDIKINIKYNRFEEYGEQIIEVRFLRGETLLHNVFYNIDGLSENEIDELKVEAVAKFSAVFPELSFEDIMRGFDITDTKIQQLYLENFGN